MTPSNYQLTSSDSVLLHGPGRPQRLYDLPAFTELDALVASGDCFITLATALDEMTEVLDSDPAVIRPQLERIIRILIHLQRHYELTRKTADRRQQNYT